MEVKEGQETEVSKDKFNDRLSPEDQANVNRLIELFEEVMKSEGKSGKLVGVGGALTKPMPRPDIDLVVVLQDAGSSPTTNTYEEAKQSLSQLESLVKEIVNREPGFKIGERLEPEIDKEFGDNPNFLRHGGSIKLIPNKGVPMELLTRSSKAFSSDKAPHAILSRV